MALTLFAGNHFPGSICLNSSGYIAFNTYRTTTRTGTTLDTSLMSMAVCYGTTGVVTGSKSVDLLLQYGAKKFYIPAYTATQSFIPLGAKYTAKATALGTHATFNSLRVCTGTASNTRSLVYTEGTAKFTVKLT